LSAPPEPAWALVRAAAPLSIEGRRFERGEIITVDLHRQRIKDLLAAQWLVALPAAEQPMLRHDPAINGPALREGSDA